MKRLIYFLLLVCFIACKSNENKQSQSTDSLATDSVRTEYTCPMHPEVVSNTQDKCPKCGMDLEPKS